MIHGFTAPAPVASEGPQGLALGPTSLFYIDGSPGRAHTLYELDPDTGAVIRSYFVDATGNKQFDGLGYLNGKIYLQEYSLNTILVWDLATEAPVATLTVPGIVGGLTGRR